jgi:hypothetical protein
MTDRGVGLARLRLGGNVRWLMYQTLIWAAGLRNDARRLCPPGNAKDGKGLADPLVDGVRGNVELCRDLLRRQELVDEDEAVDLAGGEFSDALGH